MQERNYNADNCIDNPKSVFTVLTLKEKEYLKQNYTCAFYKKGEIIFKEGDKPIGLMCLSEGKVKIFKEGVGGREQIVRMAKPVGFIGYRALFAEEHHTATGVAIEDSVACIIDKESLYKVMRSNPWGAALKVATPSAFVRTTASGTESNSTVAPSIGFPDGPTTVVVSPSPCACSICDRNSRTTSGTILKRCAHFLNMPAILAPAWLGAAAPVFRLMIIFTSISDQLMHLILFPTRILHQAVVLVDLIRRKCTQVPLG